MAPPSKQLRSTVRETTQQRPTSSGGSGSGAGSVANKPQIRRLIDDDSDSELSVLNSPSPQLSPQKRKLDEGMEGEHTDDDDDDDDDGGEKEDDNESYMSESESPSSAGESDNPYEDKEDDEEEEDDDLDSITKHTPPSRTSTMSMNRPTRRRSGVFLQQGGGSDYSAPRTVEVGDTITVASRRPHQTPAVPGRGGGSIPKTKMRIPASTRKATASKKSRTKPSTLNDDEDARAASIPTLTTPTNNNNNNNSRNNNNIDNNNNISNSNNNIVNATTIPPALALAASPSGPRVILKMASSNTAASSKTPSSSLSNSGPPAHLSRNSAATSTRKPTPDNNVTSATSKSAANTTNRSARPSARKVVQETESEEDEDQMEVDAEGETDDDKEIEGGENDDNEEQEEEEEDREDEEIDEEEEEEEDEEDEEEEEEEEDEDEDQDAEGETDDDMDEDEDKEEEVITPAISSSGFTTRTGTPDLSRLTSRQRSRLGGDFYSGDLLELPDGFERGNKAIPISAEEAALKRAEMARRRKNLTDQRLEEEKMDTINKLLKKQAPKRAPKGTRTAGDVTPATGAAGNQEDSTPSDLASRLPTMIRWVSDKDGFRLHVPECLLGTPAGRVFGESKKRSGSGGQRKMVEEIEDVTMTEVH